MPATAIISQENKPALSSNGLSYGKDGGVLAMSTNTGNIDLNGKLFVEAASNPNNPFSRLLAQTQVDQVV